jgi:hypothetical protein
MNRRLNDVTNIVKQIGQPILEALTPPQVECVNTFNAWSKFVHSSADGPTIPAELSLRQGLTTSSKLSNRLGKKPAPCTALQFACSTL